jgi:hypothetical protein
MRDDIFYDVKDLTVETLKEIILWAKQNAIRVDVDMLNCKKSFCRQKADKSFEEVFKHISNKCLGMFRIIFRKEMNTFMILSDKKEIRNIVEVFLRSIDIDGIEYFLFIYLNESKLSFLKENYNLIKL